MRRLLVDQSFPVSVQMYRNTDVELWRWNDGTARDSTLVEVAAQESCAGVLFLGLQPLADGRVLSKAREKNLWIGATHTADPVDAVTYLSSLMTALTRVVRPGAVHVVYARGIRVFDYRMIGSVDPTL